MKYILTLICASLMLSAHAQDDLLSEIESEAKSNAFDTPAFKAMKIGNLQSTKVAAKKDLYMYVSHRFGTLKDGLTTFFGFDNANTKIQLVYGLLDNVQVGVSRESLRKTYALSLKGKLKSQTERFPFNVAAYGTVNINSAIRKSTYPLLKFEDRLSYAGQLLISRKLSDRLSLEIAPTYVRQNLVHEPKQDHNQYALGAGGRIKLTKRMSVNVDYVHNFSRYEKSAFKDPLTIGVDIETGGHVFQLLFSNAQSTNEPGFISNAEGDWSKGDVFFGFNIVRVF